MNDTPTPTEQSSSVDKTTLGKLLSAALLLAALTAFALQNTDTVEVEFLSWNFDLPLIIVIGASGAIGAGRLAARHLLRRHRR